MIVLITTTSIKNEELPRVTRARPASEYHVIFMQAKDNYASRNQQDYILKSKSCVNMMLTVLLLEICERILIS